MRAWALLLAGLAVWAAHFFALYAIAGLLPARPMPAAALVAAATAFAVVAEGTILWRAQVRGHGADGLDRWLAHVTSLAAAIALLAVIWQSLPVLLV
jgi:hypothetical protein